MNKDKLLKIILQIKADLLALEEALAPKDGEPFKPQGKITWDEPVKPVGKLTKIRDFDFSTIQPAITEQR